MLTDYRFLNPNGFHLMRYLGDPQFRHIIMYGGSSSSKTYSTAQLITLQTLQDGANTLVMRKVGASIKDTIYEDFKTAIRQLGMQDKFVFKEGVKNLICLVNGAKVVFKGCDDSEKIKGIANFKRVVLDEWSEFDEEDTKQIRKRLRGQEGQQIIYTFNPIKETHWIKRNVFDTEEWVEQPMDNLVFRGVKLPRKLTKVKSLRWNKPRPILNPRTGKMEEHPSDTVVIQSTYLDNFWVVGSPDGTYGFYDEQCIADFEKDRINDPNYYNIYALGEWGVLRTGSEFFGSFNRGVHVAKCPYNPELPIHLSVDNNVLPYITITYWQIDYTNGIHIRQIAETCAGSPDNSARKSAVLVAKKLHSLGVDSVFLHGDASTRNASTIDDNKRSFLDLFIETLQNEGIAVTDCVGNKNPNVAMSGEFINAIYEKLIPEVTLTIGEDCKTSIEDYIAVQKDENGAILKTRIKNKITNQTYEEHGHISDTKRYVVVDLLREKFLAFINRRKRNLYAKDGYIHFYNPDTECKYDEDLLYCMPNINCKLVFLYGKKCGQKWHIVRVGFLETTSTEQIKKALEACNSGQIILECSKSYFPMARDLRDELEGDVKVIQESGDIPRRIAASSDYVRANMLFNEHALNEDLEYSAFMTNLLDYNKDSGENMEASAALSGFIQVVLKLGL